MKAGGLEGKKYIFSSWKSKVSSKVKAALKGGKFVWKVLKKWGREYLEVRPPVEEHLLHLQALGLACGRRVGFLLNMLFLRSVRGGVIRRLLGWGKILNKPYGLTPLAF